MSQDILLASSRKLQKGISPNMILDKSETVLYHLFYVENCLEFLCDDLLV